MLVIGSFLFSFKNTPFTISYKAVLMNSFTFVCIGKILFLPHLKKKKDKVLFVDSFLLLFLQQFGDTILLSPGLQGLC
jgi:hypothetical protein